MPEMTDAMYCHQQICVPPTFPYLLRQYCKAAIRSQPSDVLRWSCAYFRALSLGLPPPTKLRLEYPIHSTQYGMTPGWLKTLLVQIGGKRYVSWPLLYEKWTGICLNVDGLKEIILIGGFEDPAKIPWLRFVAVAAGHLTENLTNTMILICELLTEEPEGGSASILYNIFADLYKYLAAIDACKIREIRNIYFTESNLDLSKLGIPEMPTEAPSEDLDRSMASEGSHEEDYKDRFSDLQRYLKTIQLEEYEEDVESSIKEELEEEEMSKEELDPNCYVILDPEDGKVCDELHSKSGTSSSGTTTDLSLHLAEIVTEIPEEVEMYDYGEATISEVSKVATISSSTSSTDEVKLVEVFTLRPVPGIGGIVKEEMVENVLRYMSEVSIKQRGMVMPRNIKHFLCPPLEECVEYL